MTILNIYGGLIMRLICIVLLSAIVLVTSGCTTTESHARAGYDFSKLDKVAVISVEGVLRGEGAKNQLSDFMAMELLKKGYSPVERGQVQSLLKEHDFQTSSVTSNEDAARAGRILNVPAVIILNVPKFKEDMSMTIKLIDVEDGSILWIGSGTGSTGKTLSTIAGAAAGVAVGVAVSGDDDALLGAVAGGVLGGVAGNALAPQQAKKAQDIIAKICEGLPLR